MSPSPNTPSMANIPGRLTSSVEHEAAAPVARHPLDPLSPEEIAATIQIVRKVRHLDIGVRWISVELHEPPKADVLAFQEGVSFTRQAFLVIFDPATNTTSEAIVSLTTREVVSWREVPGVQPAITFTEVLEVEQVVKAHPVFQAALMRRGITNLDLVMVDSWPAGYYGPEDASTRRLGRPLVFVRTDRTDNGYAHPVEGLHILVDLAAMQVLSVEDFGVVPIPPLTGNYTPQAIGTQRTDLRALEIIQPDGPSFTVDGFAVHWQKWHFHLGWTSREGLVLFHISYEDQGRLRPILYRASLAEMIVPYGDPSPLHYRRNVLDMGEHGLGVMANALERGCDCLGHIHYFDAWVNDMQGNPVQLPNAICLHEEDAGILWKHTDFRTGQREVRRARRLVVSFFATVGIYDYGFYWWFSQDGTIGFEVKLTGILSTRAVYSGEKPPYGQLVAPHLSAILHQHFFNLRLNMMVDGLQNSVYEFHLETEPAGERNPYGNAFFAKATLLETEADAQQVIDPLAGRFWKVVNPHVHNCLDEPVGYKLMPLENALPFALPTAHIIQRAGFMTRNLWVTPYTPDERYPAGEYPNQHAGGAGLPTWTQANRSIVDTDIVLWYTLGINHVPRLEDWPVMPVRVAGFLLQPVGFFERNPSLDVPPPAPQHDGACGC